MANKSCDAAIVGGGVIGQSIALGLAEHRASVAIIDSGLATDGGATRAAGAMIDAFGENELSMTPTTQALLKMRLDGQRNYRGWIERIEDISDKTIHRNDGMFIVANAGGDHDIDHFRQIHLSMEEHKEPYQSIDPQEVPGLKSNAMFRAHSATFMPGALSVDAASLQEGLSAALKACGGVDSICDKAVRLEKNGEDWDVTLSDGQVLTAKNVVLAAGARCTELISAELREEASIPEVYYGRGVSCVAGNGPALPHAIRTPNRALACGIHIVPRAGDRIYLGASNIFGTDLSIPTGPSVGELHTMLGTVCNQLNTNLRNVSVSDFYWGLRPVTADGAPLLGATRTPGLFVATAMHRVGVTLAPLVQDILCQEILGLDNGVVNPFPIGTDPDRRPTHDISLGMRSLLATALFPDGSLPYNRSRELEVFMTELFDMAVNDQGNQGLRERIRQLYRKIPMDEQSMIRVFHEILNEKFPDGGPYPL